MGMYAFILMSMVLHIQLHILGRCAFEKMLAKQKEAKAAAEAAATDTKKADDLHFRKQDGTKQDDAVDGDAHGVRHQFLTISVDYMLNDGLENMITHVKQAIATATAE